MDSAAATTFAATGFALIVAHQFADHWMQTQTQADRKGLPGWPGHLACAGHVATYTATALAAVLAVGAAFSLPLTVWGVTAGLAISASTHYVADRRAPLRWLADRCRKSAAWLDKGGGMYALDQSWHYLWTGVAAFVIALVAQ